MNSTASSTVSLQRSASPARASGYSLGFVAMLKLMLLCIVRLRRSPSVRLSDLKHLEESLNQRLAFMQRPLVQLLLWGGACLLLPEMYSLGIGLMAALALIVVSFYALSVLIQILLNIIRFQLRIVEAGSSRLLADLRLQFSSRNIPPSLRPPLLTA